MTGSVQWAELIWVVGVLMTVTLAVSGFACFLLVMVWKGFERLRTSLEAKLSSFSTAMDEKITTFSSALRAEVEADFDALRYDHRSLETRLRVIEAERLLGEAGRAQFGEFRKEVIDQFGALRRERRVDMRLLHTRLNDALMVPPIAAPRIPQVDEDNEDDEDDEAGR